MRLAPNHPLLSGISERDVAFYLTQKGWKRAEFPRAELLVFNGPLSAHGEPIKAVIPASHEFADFPLRLQELINSLGTIENRDPLDIAQDMLDPNVDRLRVRVLAEVARAGTLPLSYATQLIQSLRDLVVAAACAEDEPQPFFRKASNVGTKLASELRFGQTERGSFVATLESSVMPPSQTVIPGESLPEPFARRVLARLMRGLGKVEHVLFSGGTVNVNDLYRDGLNANMCEALLGMKPELGEPEFEYRISWAPVLPPPPHLPAVVKLERRGMEFLESTARTLRNAQESVERQIEGRIVRLSALDPTDELEELAGERIITIRFEQEGRAQNVVVPLNSPDYRCACDAHRDGKFIKITGRLERTGKQWRLSGARDFQVVG